MSKPERARTRSALPIHQCMTFTPKDGGVQQLFEQSIDGGRTWRAGFNGTYVKRSGGDDY